MPIELHCEHCGKLVQAPDNAGGKHGQCPSCHQTMYIPNPADKIEPLELAPLDDNEEQRREELLRESLTLGLTPNEDGDVPEELTSVPPPAAGDASGPAQTSIRDIVIDYARAMAAGDLEEADKLAAELHMDFRSAEDVIQNLVADELPPLELADIPHPVLVGFFKQLSSKK